MRYKHIVACTLITLADMGMNAVFAKDLTNDKKFGYSNHYGVITPTQVYSLLQNINTAMMGYVKNHKKQHTVGVMAIKLDAVSGKTPGDAFTALNRLGDSINILVKTQKIPPVARIKQEKKKVLPAEVYLQTGNNLDTLVNFLTKLEPEQQWGDLYAINKYKKGKKPNDVYALATLVKRRFDYTMNR